MKDGKPFGIGGLWENWRDLGTGEWLGTFAVITPVAKSGNAADSVEIGKYVCVRADDAVELRCGGAARLLLEHHNQAQNRQPLLPAPDLP